MGQWYEPIWNIHENHFYDHWQERLSRINSRYQLTGENTLLTHSSTVPPPWFNGDIEAVQPGEWVLMVSLNPRVKPTETEAIQWYDDQRFTPESYWRHWRRFNENHWYPTFFYPRVRLAARVMGESVSREKARWFATERMLFVEMCPYGSGKFKFPRAGLEELSRSDLGFRIAAKVRHLLIEYGEPAVIIVNGNDAVADFELLDKRMFSWDEVRYESISEKRLRFCQGHYRISGTNMIPVIGCPFLRSINGANSFAEIDQLADHIRVFVQAA